MPKVLLATPDLPQVNLNLCRRMLDDTNMRD